MKKKEDVQQKQGERLGDSDQFLIKISSDHSFTLANWCWSCVDVEHESAYLKLSPNLKNEDGTCSHCNGTHVESTENGDKVLKFIKMLSNEKDSV